MSDPQSPSGAADREAAEWHVRLGQRPVSADTLQAFRRWRETPGATDAYRRVEALWRTAGTLSTDEDIQALTRQTLRRSAARPPRRGLRRLLPTGRFPAGLVPAAAVLVPALAAAAALLLWLPVRGLHQTGVGDQETVVLDDGSRIRLDTDTRLRVRYAPGERRIVLERGQALFAVAHDPDRPFRVEAGGTEVTALGTVFDVRRERAGARVTLVQGSVAVTDKAADRRGWRLSPGQQVRTARPDPAPVSVDAAVATSWSQGYLVFRGAPLVEAVDEVNRYLPHKIVLAAGPASDVAVSGSFAVGDRDAFVAAVADLFELSARTEADGRVRLAPRAAGG